MKKKVYLIYWDGGMDDASTIKGYIYGTEDDAEKYCDSLNEGHEYEWEDYVWEELDCLNPEK